MGLGAAVVGAAGIGAVGSIAGGIMNSNASKAASQQQYSADMAALGQERSMFNQAKSALSPYYTAGDGATSTLSNLLGTGKGGSSTIMSTLQNLPGFQFQSQYGTLSAENALAAQGLGGSTGPLASAISSYNNGLAQTNYSNYVNQLQGFASMGAGAAGALAGDAINAGNTMGQTTTSAGNALASGTLGSANALSGGLMGAAGSVGSSLLMGSMINNGGLYGSGGAYNPTAAQDAVQNYNEYGYAP